MVPDDFTFVLNVKGAAATKEEDLKEGTMPLLVTIGRSGFLTCCFNGWTWDGWKTSKTSIKNRIKNKSI